jgi:hypothetical protein
MTEQPVTNGSTDLPLPLRRWTIQLAQIAPEFVDAVGELIVRLDQWVQHPRPTAQPARPEPNGYGGVSRRGSLERLLVSQWGLAKSLPLEFLRRAVDGELLYLEPHMQAQKSQPRINVLIDCGPTQWGAPRVGQLAMLLLLTQRAAERHSTVRVGLLQADKPQWFGNDVRQLIERWQRSLAAQMATDQQLISWQHELWRNQYTVKDALAAPTNEYVFLLSDAIALERWQQCALTGASESSRMQEVYARHAQHCTLVQMREVAFSDEAQLAQLECRVITSADERAFNLPLPSDATQLALLRRPLAPLPRGDAAYSKEHPTPVDKPRVPRPPFDAEHVRVQYLPHHRAIAVRESVNYCALYANWKHFPEPQRAEDQRLTEFYRKKGEAFQSIIAVNEAGKVRATLCVDSDDGLWLSMHSAGSVNLHTKVLRRGAVLTEDPPIAPVLYHGGWYRMAMHGTCTLWFEDAIGVVWRYDMVHKNGKQRIDLRVRDQQQNRESPWFSGDVRLALAYERQGVYRQALSDRQSLTTWWCGPRVPGRHLEVTWDGRDAVIECVMAGRERIGAIHIPLQWEDRVLGVLFADHGYRYIAPNAVGIGANGMPADGQLLLLVHRNRRFFLCSEKDAKPLIHMETSLIAADWHISDGVLTWIDEERRLNCLYVNELKTIHSRQLESA